MLGPVVCVMCSLAFAARSLTLALATPAAANLGGDANTVAAIAIMSGILGVLIGQRMLGLLRIPEGKFCSVRPNPPIPINMYPTWMKG